MVYPEFNIDASEVSPDTFFLPTLGPKLRRLAEDVHRGKGFAAVRGLHIESDPSKLEEPALAFLGISSYIGHKRGRQDAKGNMLSMSTPLIDCAVEANRRLVHIKDAKLSKASQGDRPVRYSSRASVCSARCKDTHERDADLLRRRSIPTLSATSWPYRLVVVLRGEGVISLRRHGRSTMHL